MRRRIAIRWIIGVSFLGALMLLFLFFDTLSCPFEKCYKWKPASY